MRGVQHRSVGKRMRVAPMTRRVAYYMALRMAGWMRVARVAGVGGMVRQSVSSRVAQAVARRMTRYVIRRRVAGRVSSRRRVAGRMVGVRRRMCRGMAAGMAS